MSPAEYWKGIEADAQTKLAYAKGQLARLLLSASEVYTLPIEAAMADASGDE